MKPDAVIFDLDGVITDTAHLHFVAWRQVAADVGIAIDEQFNQQLKGISRMGSLERILARGGKADAFSEAEKASLASRKNALYVESLRMLTPQAVLPGIASLLAALRQEGIRIGLASVSLNAPAILQALGLAAQFDFCADAARLMHSKPDPEIFLSACAGLGVAAARCIGVEDAQAGVDAINACGMTSVGIGAELRGAQLRLDNTAELTWPRLHALWNQQRCATAR
ncbi:beta-phosphoglucomutase [Cronobacter sakazakii]|uniref:Beta-phosphoglucomutase n=1 Tax=Cronobacter sakazakii TaxID=28141 RepID=A0A7V7URV8_CROSK|nr:beta-phosphoglucomutase [Cronobacter sakazakii]CCK13630.1 Beta-phosphoglucomutase [Cronobacter sakazakii 680]AKE95860.1 beta-phosphoglucomutase [Cronobacter sakazakii]EGT4285031.1 beta-phosphoglucomutase [Cronobacter sakazakii]EGT4294119.1 beta-phosphoglucomutase [Cronobacter sakazakii]EGT4304610.1 beta-phosphoglucomutase [Cronobacter sakazakii]